MGLIEQARRDRRRPGKQGPAAEQDPGRGPGGTRELRSELLLEMPADPAQLYRLDDLHGKFAVLLGKPVKPA
jgi:hypothetical protein